MIFYDSRTRSKREFKPIAGTDVSLYVCGITPNNATHIGHAFTYVTFDVLVRYLHHKGFSVNYVQNATDINDGDDVIKQAMESGKTWREIADMWIAHFNTQMKALNVAPPTHYVLATSAIKTIITFNESLIKKGNAYEKNGNVYFSVDSFKEYGALSGFTREQMNVISAERGNNPNDPNKKNPLDFVLWIAAPEAPHWESPWGPGRPGWHIECSAMIHDYLGEQIDIHGGGRDLIFPHHESEIAQSESFTGKKPYVNFWMHNAMVIYQGEKMSKSLGNLVLVEDMLNKYSPNAIRWYLLNHHYRHPWEFIEDELAVIEKRIYDLEAKTNGPDEGEWSHIESLMDDDFDTPEVLRYLCNHCSGSVIQRALNLLGFISPQ